jgi:hypothetical protein
MLEVQRSTARSAEPTALCAMNETIRQPVTIREYFRGRSKRGRTALGLGGLIIAASVAIFAMTSTLSSAYSYVAIAVGVLGVALLFGALLYLDRTRCPNCRERLGIQIANQYGVGRRVAYCPFCGVGFDKCEFQKR